jgi:hypothetical protein
VGPVCKRKRAGNSVVSWGELGMGPLPFAAHNTLACLLRCMPMCMAPFLVCLPACFAGWCWQRAPQSSTTFPAGQVSRAGCLRGLLLRPAHRAALRPAHRRPHQRPPLFWPGLKVHPGCRPAQPCSHPSTSVRIFLLCCPSCLLTYPAGQDIPDDVIMSIAGHENFLGVKECTGEEGDEG